MAAVALSLLGTAAMASYLCMSDARLQNAWKSAQATPALVALIAFCFGGLYGGGAMTAYWTDDGTTYAAALGVVLMAFFHWSEFFLQAIFRSDVIDISSFHLDHSFAYKAMVGLFVGEYLLEALLMPSIKGSIITTLLGFVVAAGGLTVRCLAMITADQNFSHLIEDDKRDDHKLVTTGLYSIIRHPSYAGFFWWSVGMQIMLCNPISLGAAVYGNYTFFSERIKIEEEYMSSPSYFGKEYVKYKTKVPSGVPFC